MRLVIFYRAVLVGAFAMVMTAGCARQEAAMPEAPGAVSPGNKPSRKESSASGWVTFNSKPDNGGAAGPVHAKASASADDTPDVPSSDDTAFDNVDVTDASLNGKLAITRVGSEKTEAHLLSIFAGLKNKTSRRLDLEVETIYKDKWGSPLSGNSASWIPMTLKPHEEAEYRSVSISDEAADFLVRVRRAEEAKPAQ
jgi:hypothetical protein